MKSKNRISHRAKLMAMRVLRCKRNIRALLTKHKIPRKVIKRMVAKHRVFMQDYFNTAIEQELKQ